MKPASLLYILSIIVIFHAIHIILGNITSNKETFIPRLSIITDEKPDKLVINVPYILSNPQIENDIMNIKNIIINKQHFEGGVYTSPSLLTTDAFTFSHNKKNDDLFLTSLNHERGMIFIKPLELQTKTIFEDGVVIGYYNSIDKDVIQLIYSSMKDRFIVPKYTLKQIPQDTLINSNTYSTLGVDNICVFASIHSAFLKSRISDDFKFDVVDYADRLDFTKLNVFTSFGKLKTMDFSTIYPQLKGKYAPRSILAFDIIIVGSKALVTKNVSVELQSIVETTNKPDVINFYNIHYEVFPEAKNIANRLNSFAQVRNTLQILEQFNDPFEKLHVFSFDTNVIGFYDSLNNTFLINGGSIHDIPLRNNSEITLENQNRVEENGTYKVTKLDKKQTVLTKLQTISKSIDSTQFEAGYKCTDPNIKSKALCESPFLPSGEPKSKKTYWDKPCEQNLDCPFYQKNKNYPNYRGGCIDGRCEMPIGLDSVSFRQYNKSQQPLCHNCKDKLSPVCCQDQENNKHNYPTLKSPDYAFELDFFERLRSKS